MTLFYPPPPGSQCVDPSSSPVQCQSGEYSLGGSTSCTQCPGGYECSSLDAPPVACPPGEFATPGSVSCGLCDLGYFCPTNATVERFACSPGYFSDSLGTIECEICHAGSACPRTDDSPMPCALGTFALAGQTSCTLCPVGQACNSTDAAPLACPSGWFSAEGVAPCTPCPVGYFCPLSPPPASPVMVRLCYRLYIHIIRHYNVSAVFTFASCIIAYLHV